MDRLMLFGKYKGQEIKYIILTHIGYIMWCFEHISWFKLNEEEQALYDAIATASKKYHITYVFPSDLMYKHVKDKNKLNSLETPFCFYRDFTAFDTNAKKDDPICKSVEKYISGYVPIKIKKHCINDKLIAISRVINKQLQLDEEMGIEEYESSNPHSIVEYIQ